MFRVDKSEGGLEFCVPIMCESSEEYDDCALVEDGSELTKLKLFCYLEDVLDSEAGMKWAVRPAS